MALVAGSNGGASGEVRLKYAVSDARSFASVLGELGGVAKGDLILLVDPSLAAMEDGLARARRLVSEAARSGARSEFVLYYSGHSDDRGLHLGPESLSYEALRKAIAAVGADVKVAIVDSCSSGSFTRAKGGAARPAFLFDASTMAEGHAYLSSSSDDEAAQESDRLGASFFTHYFVSGLRGAADVDGRGIVTLNEAYAYAFKETLASTEGTKYGPQHPGYDISLTGSGDLVFTDLRSTSAGLSLAPALHGRVFVRDESGALAVEVDKAEGRAMDLGLGAGRYEVVLERGGERYKAGVAITQGARTSLGMSDFQAFGAAATTARGGRAQGFPTSLNLAVLPSLAGGLFSSDADRNVSINLVAGASASLAGVEFAALWNSESRDVKGFQFAGLGNLVAGGVTAFQFAGLGNYAGRDVRFSQMSGLANVAGGGLSGAQVAGLANVAGLWDGRAASIVAAHRVRGAQIAGGANFSANGVLGAQVAGAFNWSSGPVSGLQLAGAFNRAASVAGAQIGVVNLAGTVYGLQLGLVNIADRIVGLPLGLLSLEKGGVRTLEASWNAEASSAGLALKLGTRHTYNLASAAYTAGSGSPALALGLGYGGRIGLGPYFIDLDLAYRIRLSATTAWGDYASLDPGLEARAMLGFPLHAATSLVLGAALDYDLPSSGEAYLETLRTGSGLKVGLVAGVQF